MFPLVVGGKGQASGSDYEADGFAYIGVHVLADEPLPWFQDPDDVPVSIRTQSGDAGDDFRVTLGGGATIEVQAKHGASGNDDFVNAAARLFEGLQSDSALRGVLLVDTSATGTIRTEFHEDAQRLADGIHDEPRAVMKRVLDRLAERSVKLDSQTLRRFRLIVADLSPGSPAAAHAQSVLATVLVEPRRRYDAWELLGREALRVAKRGGAQDRSALAAILKPYVVLDTAAAHSRERYLDWASETNATFVVAPLPDIRLDTFEAWDELTPPRAAEALAIETDAEAIRRYHASDETSYSREAYDARKLLEEQKSAVVFGNAGSGKTTLTRRLVREACEGGFIAMRVTLKQVALAVESGKSFDDALIEAAFQGSGIDQTAARRLLDDADFLIADGLDETDPSRADVAAHLVAWMKGHPEVACIVTTRPVGHAAGLLPGLPILDLTPLTEGGTSRLARAIFSAALRDADRATLAHDAFEEEIEQNRAAALAAHNPLLLSCMVALTIGERPLPKQLAVLYEDVIDLLRRTEPHGRIVKTEAIDTYVAQRVLDAAGWLLSESPSMTRDQLVESVATRLQIEGLGNRFTCHRVAENALTFWEEHRVVERLRSGAREYLTFVHLNLGEYVAARQVATMSEESVVTWLRRVRRMPQWRQVILFAAASGAAERIAGMLLDLDDPSDPDSNEAFLAAACLEEISTPDTAVVERAIDALAARLGGASEMEAAEVLVRLARFAPKRVSTACLALLESSSFVTRLAAEAGVFAGDPTSVPEGLPRRWLEEYLPVQTIFIGKRPERVSPLPEEARELQRVAALLAIDSLFRTAPREEAETVAERFVKTQANVFMLDDLQRTLAGHGAASIIEPLIAKHHESMMRTVFKTFDKPDREELLAVLDAIAKTTGSSDEHESAARHTLPLLSRVFTALRFFELAFHSLGKREDQESLELVVERVLRGIRIDRDALRRELASAYRIANALTPRGIYAHVRRVAVQVDWRTAAAESIDPDRLRPALMHTCRAVVWGAAELLEAGAAGTSARDVISDSLAAGRRFACMLLVQVATEVLGVSEAADVIRARLRNDDTRARPLLGIFEGLTVGSAELREALADEILAAVTHPRSFVSDAAADALEKLQPLCSPQYVAALRDAREFWTTCSGWCERCDIEVAGRSCQRCHVVIQTPLPALVRELVRCKGIAEDEIRALASHDHPDVTTAAKVGATMTGRSGP